MSILNYIDTHCHLDGEEFAQDRDAIVQQAREAGCKAIFLPAIDVASCHTVLDVCAQYPNYCYPMLGLHPEEVRADWREQLLAIRNLLLAVRRDAKAESQRGAADPGRGVAPPARGRRYDTDGGRARP